MRFFAAVWQCSTVSLECVQGGPENRTFSIRHTDATVKDKLKRISLRRSQIFENKDYAVVSMQLITIPCKLLLLLLLLLLPSNCLFSRTTWVSRYQKGKTNLDFTGARDSEWQWHQLGHMQVCPHSRQITTPVPHHSVFYRPDALAAAQPTASKH